MLTRLPVSRVLRVTTIMNDDLGDFTVGGKSKELPRSTDEVKIRILHWQRSILAECMRRDANLE